MTDAAAIKLNYDEAFQEVERRLDAALNGAPGLIGSYTAHLSGARGKMIRAHAVLACALDGAGRVDPDAVAFAAAIELLHLATLVHDDVMDDADTRRGAPTLQRRFGKRTAVICGDYLLSAALRMAGSVEDRERFLKLELPDYVGRVCMGELLQQVHNGDFDLKLTDYLRIIRGKTAALFEASFYAGAILAEDGAGQVGRYARLGRYVGMIFQLTDDCIDYGLDETTAKKPVQSDFEQGVVTLPLIRAMEAEPALREGAKAGRLTADEVGRTVRRTGGLDFTRRFAKRYHDKAQALLDELDAPAEKTRRLRDILNKSYCGPKPADSAT